MNTRPRFIRGQCVAYFPSGKSKYPQKRRVTSLDETYVMIEDMGRNPTFHPMSGKKTPYAPGNGGIGYITELTPELEELAETKRILDRTKTFDFSMLSSADLRIIKAMIDQTIGRD